MTEQERLEEIEKNKIYNECGMTGELLSIELPPDDYWYLKEQAERVQELEDTIKAHDHSKNLSAVIAGENVNLKIENQRYRETIEKAERELLDKSKPLDVSVSRGLDVLIEALEEAE